VSGQDTDELRRRYFRDTAFGLTRLTPTGLTRADLDTLQRWHDDEGHQAADPINGSCFCCCEACDPREYAP